MSQPNPKNADRDLQLDFPQHVEFDYLLSRVSLLAHQTRFTSRLQPAFAQFIKRSFDIMLAATMLAALSPIFVMLAIAVKHDGGPALYKQKRVGQQRRLFDCYKFRSMRADAEQMLALHLTANLDAAQEWASYQKLKNDIRVTKFGHLLRRTSLDELPQLFNVLKGDMSFVGPRPCTPDQTHFYAEGIQLYETVRPGITGPWQVSGRNRLTFQQRVTLETWYVRNWSLGLDIIILLKTIPTLLFKNGAF